MTTAGNSGVPQGPEGGAPQDDDPFGYLYRPADGGSGQQAEPQQGVPRTNYNRPMEVGRAQYGQQPRPQQPYPPQSGYPQAQPQQPYPPQGDYAAPAQQPRYAEHSRPQPGEERPSSGRGKGAVIGAVAVVAAIAIGAGIALSGDKDKDAKDTKDAKGGTAPATAPASPGTGTGSASPTGSASATPSASASAGVPGTFDVSQLQGQNAPSGNTVKGAKSTDGSYLTLNPGGTITWTGDVAAAGTYKFTVHFNNPGADARAVATVNGKDWPGGLNLKNWSPGKEPANSWFNSYITPPLQAGTNTVVLSLPAGTGTILIDQVVLEAA
ncbi:putative Ig domain-containing protein [Kitasatospora sp. NPDC093806]|uniref:putative Ig domain-containing protein n=1 Tax=Kitasatospora sp. NPDC093806 TaxID=3155075 RepID=UPI003421E679